MTAPSLSPPAPPALRLCLWCAAAVVVDVGLYFSYRGHDARFHWFTHLFVGASVALVVMAAVAARRRRPVAYPLVWPLLAHVVAMTPDLLFTAGVAHRRWMDLFLGHISSHFVPGRNLTWYVVFLASLALYLVAVDRSRGASMAGRATEGGAPDGARKPRPEAGPRPPRWPPRRWGR